MIGVDFGRLSDHADALRGVLFNVSGGARIDEVEFEIWWRRCRVLGRRIGRSMRCEIPTLRK